MASLQTGLAALTEKAPDEVEGYRQLVLGVSQAVADAKGGVVPIEGSMLEEIRTALDGA